MIQMPQGPEWRRPTNNPDAHYRPKVYPRRPLPQQSGMSDLQKTIAMGEANRREDSPTKQIVGSCLLLAMGMLAVYALVRLLPGCDTAGEVWMTLLFFGGMSVICLLAGIAGLVRGLRRRSR